MVAFAESCVKWNDSLGPCLDWLLPEETGHSATALVGICLWEQNLALFSTCGYMLGIKVSCEQLVCVETKEFTFKTRYKGGRICFATYSELRGMAFSDYCLLTRNHKETKLSNKGLLCAPYTCQVSVRCQIEERLDTDAHHRNILKKWLDEFQCFL